MPRNSRHAAPGAAPGLSLEIEVLSLHHGVLLDLTGHSTHGGLCPGVVLSVKDAILAVRLAETAELRINARLVLYAEEDGKFLRRHVVVRSARADPRGTLAAIEAVGEPEPCERRLAYRVSAGGAVAEATLAGEPCDVLEVSATGLGVVSPKALLAGGQAALTIAYAGRSERGTASIRSAREADGGRYRYGLFVLPPRQCPGNTPFLQLLARLNTDRQREQARRLAGLSKVAAAG